MSRSSTKPKGPLVYLIGSGPGDPDLITKKGLDAIRAADVIIYDYLANPMLMEYAKDSAEKIYVGKKGYTKHITQDEINQILVEQAQKNGGQVVARLKGGDPFVFGRGGEEALVLNEYNVPFEIVPGITAGIAAPAYAGIPVTHRAVATSLTIITGHEDPTKKESQINWKALASLTGTLCFYMGVKNLPRISSELIRYGKDPQTPMALIRWGTTAEQKTLETTLETCAKDAKAAHFKAPAIILVGEVASLRENLRWFDKKPLFGKRFVVTRSRSQMSKLTKKLTNLGASVFEFPTIAFREPQNSNLLSQAIENISTYDWLVLTSTNGVDAFFKEVRAQNLDARILGGVKVATIGPATAKCLEGYGIKTDLLPKSYVAESVLDAMFKKGVGKGTKVLIARAKDARRVLPDELKQAGVEVDVVPAYETVLPESSHTEDLLKELDAGNIDGITFTSSSTCKNLCKLIEDAGRNPKEVLKNIDAYSIGPVTSQTMLEKGIEVCKEASEYTIDGLVHAICEDVSNT